MPSFNSAAAELRFLARSWNTGGRAFNELFTVHVKEPDAAYNPVTLNEDVSPDTRLLWAEVDEAWTDREAKNQTKGLARQVREKRRELAEQGLEGRDLTRQMRPFREELNARRESVRQDLIAQGGMLGALNRVEKTSQGSNLKALMRLSLGYRAEELEEES